MYSKVLSHTVGYFAIDVNHVDRKTDIIDTWGCIQSFMSHLLPTFSIWLPGGSMEADKSGQQELLPITMGCQQSTDM